MYCERDGTPLAPADLSKLAALALGMRSGEAVWKLRDGNGAEASVPITPRLSSDDLGTLKAAAVANLGIVALPWYTASREVSQGTLRRVLPEWIAGDNQITLLAPSRRGQLPSVRAFIDFLVAEFPATLASPL